MAGNTLGENVLDKDSGLKINPENFVFFDVGEYAYSLAASKIKNCELCARKISEVSRSNKIVVEKSTVPNIKIYCKLHCNV